MKSHVEFKGTKEGIILQMKDSSNIEDIIDSIKGKLDASINFFKGAEIIAVEGKILELNEKRLIKNIVEKAYGLEVLSLETLKKEVSDPEIEISEETETDTINQAIECMKSDSQFVHGTMRSGKRVEHDGNIIVIGDVNPGAEVIAGKNVVIMGTLRGIAHAGKDGDEEAFVAALNFQAVQVRIGTKISRAPDDSGDMPNEPEIAYVKNDMIVIETYL